MIYTRFQKIWKSWVIFFVQTLQNDVILIIWSLMSMSGVSKSWNPKISVSDTLFRRGGHHQNQHHRNSWNQKWYPRKWSGAKIFLGFNKYIYGRLQILVVELIEWLCDIEQVLYFFKKPQKQAKSSVLAFFPSLGHPTTMVSQSINPTTRIPSDPY